MQVGSEVREISCVLLAEFQMKIHFNLEVWSKENSTGVASTYFNFEHGGKLLQEYMGYINRKIGEIWRRWGRG